MILEQWFNKTHIKIEGLAQVNAKMGKNDNVSIRDVYQLLKVTNLHKMQWSNLLNRFK